MQIIKNRKEVVLMGQTLASAIGILVLTTRIDQELTS